MVWHSDAELGKAQQNTASQGMALQSAAEHGMVRQGVAALGIAWHSPAGRGVAELRGAQQSKAIQGKGTKMITPGTLQTMDATERQAIQNVIGRLRGRDADSEVAELLRGPLGRYLEPWVIAPLELLAKEDRDSAELRLALDRSE